MKNNKELWLAILTTGMFMSMGTGKVYASELNAAQFKECKTIRYQYIQKDLIVDDGVDIFTNHMSKNDAIEAAVKRSKEEGGQFNNNNGHCSVTVILK